MTSCDPPAAGGHPGNLNMPVLGIDYGEKRVGFAVSDPSGTMALTLRTVEVRSQADALQQAADICREVGAGRIVVGLPLNMNGSRGPMAEKVELFVSRLAASVAVPVVTSDERLSTSTVERSLIEADVSRARRKHLRDKLAAQVILQGYLDGIVTAEGHPDDDAE